MTTMTIPAGAPEAGALQRVRRDPEPHSCRDCSRQWTGDRPAHCAGCHRTFSSDSAFDEHQRLDHGPCASRPENRKQTHRVCYARSVCLDPATLRRPNGSHRLVEFPTRSGV
jgi:hypothetical protein